MKITVNNVGRPPTEELVAGRLYVWSYEGEDLYGVYNPVFHGLMLLNPSKKGHTWLNLSAGVNCTVAVKAFHGSITLEND